jgi:hypothetical protein
MKTIPLHYRVQLIAACIWAHNQYIKVCSFCAKWILMIVYLHRMINWVYSALCTAKDIKIVCVMTRPGGLDVTKEVSLYYLFDSIRSVASLHRWLAMYNVHDPHLDMVTARNGKIHVSRIDLLNDIEMFNKGPIHNGDMSMEKIPSACIDLME